MNILVIGEINLDCVSRLIDYKLKGGFSIGGKGYNIACNLKYFKQNVDFYTKIGKDALGKFLITECKNKNINIFYEYFNRKTNCSVAFHNKNKLEYDIFYKQEAWKCFNLPNKDYDKIIISVSLKERDLIEIFKKYNKAKFYLSINSTYIHKYYYKYLNKFELIFCNYDEAKLFTKNNENLKIKKLVNLLSSNFIITKDKEGVFFKDNEKIENVKSVIDQKLIKSVYGAGDCFTSSFLFFYWQGLSKKISAQKSINYTHLILKRNKSNLL